MDLNNLPEGILYSDVIQVSSDGGTLWVHALDGSTIGRFSKRHGIDVHTTVTDQLSGSSQCLFCTHEPAGPEDWNRFLDALREHHQVVLPADTLTFPGS